jgi:O-methyltransferase domain/Dimerisation domain
MVRASWVSAALHTAVELRIPDLLADGPRFAEDLAEASGAAPDPLRRLLRTLAAHEVVAERADGRFEKTAISDLLREDVPGLRSLLLMYGHPVWWAAWGAMAHAIRTGETAFSKVHGDELFAYMKRDAEMNALFNRVMTEGSVRLAAEIVAACDFTPFGTVVDLGGGQGWLLSAILAAVPAARGILFDQPHVVETARPVLAERGVAERCEVVGGSFFESVPGGGDAYTMKWIIHDWDDDDATKILRNVRAVMPSGARLFVFDRVLPAQMTGNDHLAQQGTLSDLNMLVNVTGRERTEAEFRELFQASGFSLTSARNTSSEIGIVEGVPA